MSLSSLLSSRRRQGRQVSVDAVRQAGGHLRYVEGQRSESVPGDSSTLLITPEQTVHPAAVAIAEATVFLVLPGAVLDLFDRLVRAWRAARAQSGVSVSVEHLYPLFETEGALPSQWLPALQARPVHTSLAPA